MSNLSLTIHAETPEAMIADLQRLFPALVAGKGLPPMQEQPKNEPAPEPKPKKAKTEKEAKKDDAGKSETAAPTTISPESSPEPEGSSEVPDVDAVRTALKALAAAKGEEDVFALLSKYKAKSASTVAEGDRAKLIAEITQVLG